MRQVLTESVVLAGCAGLAAIGLAFAGVALLKSTAIGYVNPRFPLAAASVLPRIDEISIDPTVLTFVVVASALTGVVFGLLPALRLSRYGERGHASAAQMSAHAGDTRLGHVLATVQLAFAAPEETRRRSKQTRRNEALGRLRPRALRVYRGL
jgi:hypothetical protein